MSMTSWSRTCYGFELFNGDNFRKVVEFCKGAPNLRPDIDEKELETAIEDEDEYAVAEILSDKYAELAPIVADRIINETGVTCICGFEACADTNLDSHIGIIPVFPWEPGARAFNNSDLEAKEFLIDYAEKLGITKEPDYEELEYYG